MKFKYKNIEPGINRPIIPIQVRYNKSLPINYEVLVDSGADVCIFPSEIGVLLGVDIRSGKKFGVKGITGKTEPYYIHEVDLSIGGKWITVEVGFMYNPGSDWHGVVGQKGFFEKFTVKFDYSKNEVEIK